MSSMQPVRQDLTRFRPWLQGIAVLIAIAIPVQALLGTQSFFDANETMKDAHVGIGNTLFLIAVIQAGLAFYVLKGKVVDTADLVMRIALVILIAAQMMLGFSGRDDAELKGYHIAFGVLLMGLATVIATRSFTRPRD